MIVSLVSVSDIHLGTYNSGNFHPLTSLKNILKSPEWSSECIVLRGD